MTKMKQCKNKSFNCNKEKPMKWIKNIRDDGRVEWICSCGVGHGNHVHGCCGYSCCMRKDFPLNKGKKQ